MVRILVNPDRLQTLSADLRSAAEELRQLEGWLNRALSNIDLDVRQRTNADEAIQQATALTRATAERTTEMAAYLTRKAQAFTAADQQGATGLPTTPVTPFPMPVPTPTPRGWPFSPVQHTHVTPPPKAG